jgi:cell division transport system ATP-binding protein
MRPANVIPLAAGRPVVPGDPLRRAAEVGVQPLIQLDRVGMRYGAGPEVLSDLTVSIPAGSFHFVKGPSGAGKSSLLRLLHLSYRPARGRLILFGRDVTGLDRRALPPLRRRIGMVFQDFRLIGHLSALDNVTLPLRLAGFRDDQYRGHVIELLRWVGLGDRLPARPAELSGGEQQRLAIARAVVTKPDLLMADEPIGNVDDEAGVRLIRLFEELNRLGATVLVATHSGGLVARFDHPVLELRDGRLAGAPESAGAGPGAGSGTGAAA